MADRALLAMRIRTLIELCGICTILILPGMLPADGVIRDGIGPISTGRGGTNLGFADNAAIIYDNPAGMSNIANTGLMEVGIDTVICDLNYSDPQNQNVDSIRRAFPPGMFGYVKRLPDSPWTF